MKVAFLGLGSMGMPMARNLLRAGHEVAAWNRSPEKAEALAAEGARVARTPVDAVEGAEAAVTMVADDVALRDVTFGDFGLMAGLSPGAVHLSMSTIGAGVAVLMTDAHAQGGQTFVSAPVFGRPPAAEAAKLKIVAAGPADAVERCRPLFDALGDRTFVVGESPVQANVVKLCGNFLIASMIEALGEAFALARKSGVEPASLQEVLGGSLFAGSPIFSVYLAQIAEGRYTPPGFKMRLGLKDVRLALEAADAAEVPMPLGSLLRDHLLSAVARGRGEIDWAGLAGVIAEDAGLSM